MPDFFVAKNTKNLLRGIKKSKRKSKRKKIIISIIIAVLVLGGVSALIATVYVPKIKNAIHEAQLAKQSLNDGQAYLLAQDFEKGRNEIESAEEHLKNINVTLDGLSWVQFLPYIRIQYTAANQVLLGANYMIDGIYDLIDVTESVLVPLQNTDANSFDSITDADREEILAALYNSQPKFEIIQQTFKKANDEFDKIPEKGLIKQLRDAILPIQEEIPSINKAIDTLVPLSKGLPIFLGYPTQQDYLLLFQNNTELRPTGGFIGTYGIVKLKNADVIYLESDNVYNLDEPAKDNGLSIEPPAPLYQYNKVTRWFLRDSNWSPDFPTSAQKALEFYSLEGGNEKNLDGVIALDPSFIVSLLEITGPITVSGTEFTEENFVQKLQEHVSQGFIWQGLDTSTRKDIIGDLGEELMDRLYKLPKIRWQEIFIALEKNLSQKHFMIWAKEPAVQSILAEQNWDGHIPQVEGQNDIIFIDANLASLKTDPAVDRSVQYTVDEQQNGSFTITTTRTYKNTGKLNWNTTRYRTYTRAYVPDGSTLISSSGAMIDCKIDGGTVETSTELSHTVFSFFVCIEPGEENSISLTYTLPDDIFTRKLLNNTFNIAVFKQAGTVGDSYSIQTNFKNKIKDSPSHVDKKMEISNTQLFFEDIIDKDKLYTFTF